MKNVLKIVLVIIGTMVGAGFASGKEIYSFFFVYKYARDYWNDWFKLNNWCDNI